jgi:phage major head subunit gpT-like protein
LAGLISGGVIVPGNISDFLERGLRHVYFNEVKEAVKQFIQIYMIDGSVKQQETDGVMAGVGQYYPKAIGAPAQQDSMAEAYKKVYVHNTFALQVRIALETMEDDLYGVIPDAGRELARAAVYTQEVNAMDLLNNAGTAVVYTANGTGYPLLSQTQFRADGGVWSNQLSSGADLTIESLEALLNQWSSGMVDQRGRKLAIQPTRLVVGTDDRFNAQRIVNSIQRPFTADNDPNTVRALGLQPIVLTHMTNDGRWFLMAEKDECSVLWFNRRPVSLQRETDGLATGNLVLTGSYRESHGITSPVGVAGSL